jgi:hypothetical protein
MGELRWGWGERTIVDLGQRCTEYRLSTKRIVFSVYVRCVRPRRLEVDLLCYAAYDTASPLPLQVFVGILSSLLS